MQNNAQFTTFVLACVQWKENKQNKTKHLCHVMSNTA